MVLLHGVAGYQSGCRCPECSTKQFAREAAIAEAETKRWEAFWAQRRSADAAVRDGRSEPGRETEKRRARAPSARRSGNAVRRVEPEVSVTDHKTWLLSQLRQAGAQLQGRSAKLRQWAASAGYTDLLWQQAHERFALAERQLAELTALWETRHVQ